MNMRPGGLLHGLPVSKRFEAPFQQKGRFVLFSGDQPDYIFIESRWGAISLDVRHEAVLVILFYQAFDCFCCRAHSVDVLKIQGSLAAGSRI